MTDISKWVMKLYGMHLNIIIEDIIIFLLKIS